ASPRYATSSTAPRRVEPISAGGVCFLVLSRRVLTFVNTVEKRSHDTDNDPFRRGKRRAPRRTGAPAWRDRRADSPGAAALYAPGIRRDDGAGRGASCSR